MCIIIDSDSIYHFFKKPDHVNMRPLHTWLKRSGRIVYSTGDKFSTELKKDVRKQLEQLFRRGKALFIADDKVASEVQNLINLKQRLGIVSDDLHILALARLSKTSLLVSGDTKLHKDFKNRDIIPFQVKIYQDKSHDHFLPDTGCTIGK